jgi:hypothetical protein
MYRYHVYTMTPYVITMVTWTHCLHIKHEIHSLDIALTFEGHHVVSTVDFNILGHTYIHKLRSFKNKLAKCLKGEDIQIVSACVVDGIQVLLPTLTVARCRGKHPALPHFYTTASMWHSVQIAHSYTRGTTGKQMSRIVSSWFLTPF